MVFVAVWGVPPGLCEESRVFLAVCGLRLPIRCAGEIWVPNYVERRIYKELRNHVITYVIT